MTITPANSQTWAPPEPGEWTYEDYTRLPDSDVQYEIIDGHLYMMTPSPNTRHQRIVFELAYRMRLHIEQHRQGGELFIAPLDVKIKGVRNVVQPDLIYVAADNKGVVTEPRIEGVPDLLVEIISPNSTAHDRERKRDLYMEAGVREYWIVDPIEQLGIDIYLHGHAEAADRQGFLHAYSHRVGDTASSQVIEGFQIAVASLFNV